MKNTKHQHQLTPEQYLRTRVRKLPIDCCYINENWRENNMAIVVVVRRHSNENCTFGFYLVDLLALGTKDTYFEFNMPETEMLKILHNTGEETMIKTEYKLAHNIIYGANAFAEDNGFKVCKEFELTQFILEEDTEDIELIDIEFGMNGKPFFMY